MSEHGYDTEGMRIFSDETMELELPLSEVPKDAIEKLLGGVLITRCEHCRFFLENWKCTVWKMFVKPSGFCYRAKENSEEPEESDEDSCCV